MVAADQAAGVVQEPLANRAVLRQQLGVKLLQRGSGVGAEPVADLLAVPLVPVERGRGAALGGLAAQEGREQRFVIGVVGQCGLEQSERLGVTAESGQGAAEDGAGLGDVGASLAAYLLERAVAGGGTHRRPDHGRGLVAGPDQVAGGLGGASGHDVGAHTERVDGSSGTPRR